MDRHDTAEDMNRCAQVYQLGRQAAEAERARIEAARQAEAEAYQRACASAQSLAADLRCALHGIEAPRWYFWRFWRRVPIASTVRVRKNRVTLAWSTVRDHGRIEVGFTTQGPSLARALIHTGPYEWSEESASAVDRIVSQVVREVVRRLG